MNQYQRFHRQSPAPHTQEPSNLKPGTLKWYDADRCYGFIIPADDDGTREIFFHKSTVTGSGLKPDWLRNGIAVQYADTPDPRPGKSPRATFLKIVA